MKVSTGSLSGRASQTRLQHGVIINSSRKEQVSVGTEGQAAAINDTTVEFVSALHHQNSILSAR